MTERPFCPDKRARDAFDTWARLVRDAGHEMSEADAYVVGVAANATARLEAAAEARAREKDPATRLRLMKAERDIALEMHRVLDLVSRHFAVDVEAGTVEVSRTGTDGNVVAFAPRLRLQTAQRILAALESKPLTMSALRKRVAGNETDFRAGLREALKAGAIQRKGLGRKGNPFTYSRSSS